MVGDKSADAYRTISEVATDLDIPQHVLRFWETRFTQIKPLKRGGGRRYYRPEDVALLRGIRSLLYGQGYTIKGLQRILREQGVKVVQAAGRGERPPLVVEASAEPDEAADIAAMREPAPAVETRERGLAPSIRERLEAIVAELSECRRLLETVRAR